MSNYDYDDYWIDEETEEEKQERMETMQLGEKLLKKINENFKGKIKNGLLKLNFSVNPNFVRFIKEAEIVAVVIKESDHEMDLFNSGYILLKKGDLVLPVNADWGFPFSLSDELKKAFKLDKKEEERVNKELFTFWFSDVINTYRYDLLRNYAVELGYITEEEVIQEELEKHY